MIRFFDPTPEFIDWLVKYANGRVVVDVGCGDCFLLKSLLKRGVKALSVDPRYEWDKLPAGMKNFVVPRNGQDCNFLKTTPNMLVLFCRPCHSGFVAETIDVLHSTAEVLYISKPCNVVTDLDPCETEVTELETPPCPEEKVYQVRRTEWETKNERVVQWDKEQSRHLRALLAR